MKHKLLLQRFFASLLLLAVSTLSWAYSFKVDGIYYVTLSQSTAQVVPNPSGKYSGSITIPFSVKDGTTFHVVAIAASAFEGCSDLTSISIPNSVTSIGDNAFRNCSGLTSITIPYSVTSIGNQAFNGCSGLTSITVGDNNPVYDSREGCNAIIESSTNALIRGCSNTVVPSNVTSINDYAFHGCDNLTSITIPESVTDIGSYAFINCSNLTIVTINSDALLSKTYSSNDNMRTRFHMQVEEYIIGDNVTSIGQYAFSGCGQLKSLTIGCRVASIGKDAFVGTSLTGGNVTINSDALLSKKYTTTNNMKNYFGTPRKLIIGGDVTTIGDYAFYGYAISFDCSVIIKNGVKNIGRSAFATNSSITYISLPESLERVGKDAFSGCTGIYYDSQYLRYVEDCLVEVLLKTLDTYTIEEGTRVIANAAFSDMTNLKSLTIPESVTSIDDWAFAGCSGLTSVTIPEDVRIIGKEAFRGCSSLTSINIPNSVTSIDDRAFQYCSGLTSINIPNSVTSIGKEAFWGCSGLTSINIPNSVTSIGELTFSNCSGLTSVTIGNSVTSIGWSAFYGCSGLTSVTIPNSVTSIGSGAFYGCSGLTSVTIGSGVTSIDQGAFRGCSGLMSVTCKAAEVPITGENVFYDVPQRQATLYVPEGSIDIYKEAEQWCKFRTILPISGSDPEIPQCAKPTIKYSNGNLSFESETEGVEFVSEITDSDVKKYNSVEIDLTVTYNVTVYATKAGYDNSEVATATLCWIDASPEGEGFINGVAELEARPVILQTRGNIIDITGVKEGEDIKVYGVGGQLAGSAKASDESVSVPTTLNSGSIAIVKIGEKSVKIVMK